MVVVVRAQRDFGLTHTERASAATLYLSNPTDVAAAWQVTNAMVFPEYNRLIARPNLVDRRRAKIGQTHSPQLYYDTSQNPSCLIFFSGRRRPIKKNTHTPPSACMPHAHALKNGLRLP
jgi:hypothetical protein